MMRHYFSDRRQVEVDTCPHCGGVMAIIAVRVREINPAPA
jgi:hypothetical protein